MRRSRRAFLLIQGSVLLAVLGALTALRPSSVRAVRPEVDHRLAVDGRERIALGRPPVWRDRHDRGCSPTGRRDSTWTDGTPTADVPYDRATTRTARRPAGSPTRRATPSTCWDARGEVWTTRIVGLYLHIRPPHRKARESSDYGLAIEARPRPVGGPTSIAPGGPARRVKRGAASLATGRGGAIMPIATGN